MAQPSDEVIFDSMARAFALSQDYPRKEVVRRQTALLERLIRFAHTEVPFYRDTGRLKPLFRADGRFDMAGWTDVPVLTRNEAKANEAALQADRIPIEMGQLATRSTSGTTGTPLEFRQTRVQFFATEAWLNRLLQWHNAWPIRRIATHGGGVESTGDEHMLKVPGRIPFTDQVALLRERRITHILSAPSMGEGWAEAAPSKLRDLAAFVATGEVLRPEVRDKIQRRLGGKVINLYSTSEIGPLAGEGPDGRLRVSEETVFLEGPTAGVDEGGFTPVVVTPFYAFGTPLIRYAPGDVVRFSKTPFKRAPGLRRLDEVVGRRRNLFRQPDGRRFLPGRIVARGLSAILDYREWQLVQTSLDDIVMRMVTPRPPTAAEVARLEAYIQESLPNHRTQVEFVDSVNEALGEGKAYEMFLCLVDD